MKVKLNISAIGNSLDESIGEKLRERNFPECFGKFGMPIAREYILIDPENVFQLRESVSYEEIADQDIEKYLLTSSDAVLLAGCVLTYGGIEYIKAKKDEIATQLAEKLIACGKCKLFDMCEKIYRNYLETIKLHLN